MTDRMKFLQHLKELLQTQVFQFKLASQLLALICPFNGGESVELGCLGELSVPGGKGLIWAICAINPLALLWEEPGHRAASLGQDDLWSTRAQVGTCKLQ